MDGTRTKDAEKEAAEWLKAQEAELNQRYEKELMNPKEGARARLDLLARHADRPAQGARREPEFLLRHYKPSPMSRPAARVPLGPGAIHDLGSRLETTPMAPTADWYRTNPLIHRDRRLGEVPLRVGALLRLRGPEAAHRLPRPDPQGGDGRLRARWGSRHYGILLSEKDSIVYANALAPELRQLTDPSRVHRVPDYTGATQGGARRADEPDHPDRARQRLRLRVRRLRLHGRGRGVRRARSRRPASSSSARTRVTQARAGKKDEAKRTALEVGVCVTPGVNDVTARTLAREAPDAQGAARARRRPRSSPATRRSLEDEKLLARGARRSRPHGVVREGDRPLHHRRARRAGAARGRRAVQRSTPAAASA